MVTLTCWIYFQIYLNVTKPLHKDSTSAFMFLSGGCSTQLSQQGADVVPRFSPKKKKKSTKTLMCSLSIDTGQQQRSLVPPSLVMISAVGPGVTGSIPSKSGHAWRSDGHRASSVEQAVPHDAIFTWEVSGGQQDSSEPMTGEQKDRFSHLQTWVQDPQSEISGNIKIVLLFMFCISKKESYGSLGVINKTGNNCDANPVLLILREWDLNSPSFFHTEEQLPVVHSTVIIRVSKKLRPEGSASKTLEHLQLYKRCCIYLALLPQSFALFAVDMSLHAGLPPADEDGMPQGESSESHRHRAAGGKRRLIFTCNFGHIFLHIFLWYPIRPKNPYLVSTQRKMTHLWAVAALKVSLGEGVW